jgi:hypothetical protein
MTQSNPHEFERCIGVYSTINIFSASSKTKRDSFMIHLMTRWVQENNLVLPPKTKKESTSQCRQGSRISWNFAHEMQSLPFPCWAVTSPIFEWISGEKSVEDPRFWLLNYTQWSHIMHVITFGQICRECHSAVPKNCIDYCITLVAAWDK